MTMRASRRRLKRGLEPTDSNTRGPEVPFEEMAKILLFYVSLYD